MNRLLSNLAKLPLLGHISIACALATGHWWWISLSILAFLVAATCLEYDGIQSTQKSVQAALDEYLKHPEFEFTRIDAKHLLRDDAFHHVMKQNKFMLDGPHIKEETLLRVWKGKPLEVLLVRSKSPELLLNTNPVAYVSRNSTSYIFLTTEPDNASPLQKFICLHELDHVASGAAAISPGFRGISMAAMMTGPLLFLSTKESILGPLVAIHWMADAFVFRHLPKITLEVDADLNAFAQLTKAEQEAVATLLAKSIERKRLAGKMSRADWYRLFALRIRGGKHYSHIGWSDFSAVRLISAVPLSIGVAYSYAGVPPVSWKWLLLTASCLYFGQYVAWGMLRGVSADLEQADRLIEERCA